MLDTRPKDRRAFTLVELVVVIAITGLIIAMIIPSLKRSLRLANATVCMHNLREMGHALQLYRIEHGGWIPTTTVMQTSLADHPKLHAWFLKLYPVYFSDVTILTCPEDPLRYQFLRVGPEDENALDRVGYGISGFITGVAGGAAANLDRHRSARPVSTILMADLGPDSVSSRPYPSLPLGPIRNMGRTALDDGYDPYAPNPAQPWITTRHGYGINMLTLSSSVHEVRTAETIRSRVQPFYTQCAQGGCTICNEMQVPHYSFAHAGLFWWTGPAPRE